MLVCLTQGAPRAHFDVHQYREVDVELTLVGEQAVIRIEDRGEGFDPELVDNPLAPENLLKPSGRGIFYMKNFMDDIDYLLHSSRCLPKSRRFASQSVVASSTST